LPLRRRRLGLARQHHQHGQRYELDPALDGATCVRHTFVHGPGDSGLRSMMRHPELSAEIIEDRRQTVRENMRQRSPR
jgi:hypothetical protein